MVSTAEDRLLASADVTRRLGISKVTLHRYVTAGRFPPGIKIGLRAVRWRESVVNAWIDQRAAACDQQYDVAERA